MSCYIKRISIHGYRKFKELDFEFNPKMNILIGENEAGKSTILDAIRLVLCQDYRNSEKVYWNDMFNKDSVNEFMLSKSPEKLPSIHIELEFHLEPDMVNAENFYGEQHSFDKERRFGVAFDCSFDRDLGVGLDADIAKGVLPIEYYVPKWTTFSGQAYVVQRKPFGFMPIDTSELRKGTAFDFFSKTLFETVIDSSSRLKAKNDFRDSLRKSFEDLGLAPLPNGRQFAINDKKIGLESVLSVSDGGILLENKGSGVANLVKTSVALQRSTGSIAVVTIEEPENHLSYVNMRKMIEGIKKRSDECQLIIATHSNMIASSLGLRNIIWLNGMNGVMKLNDLDESVDLFFVKSDTSRMLDFLLARKILLVEGPTEYLLMPKFIKQKTGKTIDELGLSIIACDGVSYAKFLSLDQNANKRIAVMTDNDGDGDKIEKAKNYNATHINSRIFMPSVITEWTWEVCFYEKNKLSLESQFPAEPGAQYVFNGKPYPNTLGRMLHNKADIAYKMLVCETEYNLPQYVEEAIEWLKE